MTTLNAFKALPDALDLFKNVTKLSQFKTKLNKLADELPIKNTDWSSGDSDLEKREDRDNILGKGFELFCECLVAISGADKDIGLDEYTPVHDNDDLGVDAYAINTDMEKTAIQCKYSSNPTHEYSTKNSNIQSFLVEAYFNGIDFREEKKTSNLVFITTGTGLHYHTAEKKFRNRVRVINFKDIEKIVDDNKLFWDKCFKRVAKGVLDSE